MRRKRQLAMRLARFTAVGSVCFALQAGLLLALREAGAPLTLANAVGFVASAQVNFALSTCFTWSDRRIPLTDLKATGARWTSFQLTVGTGLIFNSAVFAFAVRILDPVFAAGIGVLAGALLTFLSSNYLVFRKRHIHNDSSPEPHGGSLDHHRSTSALPRVGGGTAAD